MSKLYINISRPRKEFKQSLGQANHFLVTALIGLDYIRNNEVSCPESFSTTWNPKNKEASVQRTRQYILNSSLAWTIDCLDVYLAKCNREPKLIENEEIIRLFDGTHRSVNEKFQTLTEFIEKSINDVSGFNIYKSISGLAIQWRNNTMHSNASNELEQKYRKILLDSAKKIKEIFCGLDIEQSLHRFDEYQPPTFKEVTSMIRGVHNLVEMIDRCMLSQMDIYDYAHKIINRHLKDNGIHPSFILSLSAPRRASKFINILKNYSFSEKLQDDALYIDIDELLTLWAKL